LRSRRHRGLRRRLAVEAGQLRTRVSAWPGRRRTKPAGRRTREPAEAPWPLPGEPFRLTGEAWLLPGDAALLLTAKPGLLTAKPGLLTGKPGLLTAKVGLLPAGARRRLAGEALWLAAGEALLTGEALLAGEAWLLTERASRLAPGEAVVGPRAVAAGVAPGGVALALSLARVSGRRLAAWGGVTRLRGWPSLRGKPGTPVLAHRPLVGAAAGTAARQPVSDASSRARCGRRAAGAVRRLPGRGAGTV
jgi:hypothetical protein